MRFRSKREPIFYDFGRKGKRTKRVPPPRFRSSEPATNGHPVLQVRVSARRGVHLVAARNKWVSPRRGDVILTYARVRGVVGVEAAAAAATDTPRVRRRPMSCVLLFSSSSSFFPSILSVCYFFFPAFFFSSVEWAARSVSVTRTAIGHGRAIHNGRATTHRFRRARRDPVPTVRLVARAQCAPPSSVRPSRWRRSPSSWDDRTDEIPVSQPRILRP